MLHPAHREKNPRECSSGTSNGGRHANNTPSPANVHRPPTTSTNSGCRYNLRHKRPRQRSCPHLSLSSTKHTQPTVRGAMRQVKTSKTCQDKQTSHTTRRWKQPKPYEKTPRVPSEMKRRNCKLKLVRCSSKLQIFILALSNCSIFQRWCLQLDCQFLKQVRQYFVQLHHASDIFRFKLCMLCVKKSAGSH